MPDESVHSVTHWIQGLKQGDEDVVHQLWERYFEQLVRLARRRLGGAARRAADEEDVAVSVFESLCHGAMQGRFSRLTDRHDLWLLLLAITRQKAADLMRRENRQKRGGGKVRDEQALVGADGRELRLADLVKGGPTPDFVVALDEEFRYLLKQLDHEGHRLVAVMRMEGYTNQEIAVAVQRTERTVERWHAIVRKTWERELQ